MSEWVSESEWFGRNIFRVESKAEAKKARLALGALGSQLRFHLHLRASAAVLLYSLRVRSLYEVA